MKKILEITSVFIGLVIGAGFASGREIYEYFCIPSQTDFLGIIIATIGFGIICYITMCLAKKTKSKDFNSLINNVTGRIAPAVRLFMLCFMFCGFFIMLSACGALAQETMNISPRYGIFFLAAVCFAVFSFDVKGIVMLNVVLVPLMILGMFWICITTILGTTPTFATLESIKTNPIVSSLCYISYNTVTAGAVLVPLSASATKKQITASSALSGTVLGLLIFIAWLCMNLFFDRLFLSEMPLLELAATNGNLTEGIYTAVLFMALCTTAVSHGFGILSKISFSRPHYRIVTSGILCLIAIPFAELGFANLVSNLYAIFGYLGIPWVILLIRSHFSA